MKNDQDPRIIKTKKKLEQAFLLLLKSYSVSDINVRQITDEAGVTRGAFYTHYIDKNDFISKVLEGILHELMSHAVIDASKTISSVKNKPHDANTLSLLNFFNYMAERYKDFMTLLINDDFQDFYQILDRCLEKEMIHFGTIYSEYLDLGGFPLQVYVSFYIQGVLGMTVKWLSNGMVYTPHYMANAAKRLLVEKNIEVNVIHLTDFFSE